MSRTDVHRPAWVVDRDPTLRRFFREHHDHTTGPCDLGVFLTAKGWTRTRCRLDYYGGANIYCGCRMCTGHDGRKLAHQRDRTAWRAIRQQLLASAAEDRADVNVSPARESAW